MHRTLRVALVSTLVLTLAVAVGCHGRRSVTVSPSSDVTAPPSTVAVAPVTFPDGPQVGDVVSVTRVGTRTVRVQDVAVADAPPALDTGASPLLDDVRVRSAVERDKIRFVVQQKLEVARIHIHNGDYAAAEKELVTAQELEPSNRDVRTELRDVQALLGRRPAGAGDMLDTMRQLTKVRIDEQRTTAAKYVNLGRMHLANRQYDDAIENFERATFIIESSPYDVDWNNLEEEADRGLRESRRSKIDSERAEHRAAVESSLADLAREEEQRLLAEQERLERLLGSAIEAFDRGDYENAQFYAERVLEVQPDNTKARDLQMAARRAYHDQVEGEYLRREKLAFREWMIDIQNTRLLQDKILKWPSQSFWDRITEVRKHTRTSFGKSESDPEGDALLAKAKTTNVNLQVSNQEFKEVLKLLQIQTRMNIVIDPRIESDVSENPVVGLFVEDLPLATVLDFLQGSAGEDVIWTTHGNVIKFTKKEYAQKSLTVELHDVADLTTGLTNFIPPTIQLVGPNNVSDDENPLFGAEGEEPVLPYGTIEELIELIQNAVAPGFWENTEGAQIRSQGEHVLVVKATDEVQQSVTQFLNDLRGFAGLVVTVQARFLEVGDYFLRDVGVDMRGLGGETPGTLVNLDDVTNGLEDAASAGYDNGGGGLTTGAALNPSSGIYFNDGGDGDFRAHSENIFENSLGTVLSALGGGSFTFSMIGDTEMAMILHAVEKDAKARTLTAPKITVFNTQRANLTVVNQLSYIQDFDVEVAQTSFIADPIVGIIQDGLTLDVRPTVSNDRRYITLELQPTVANLIQPIPTFATTLASSFSAVIIQLPELRIQQARVTVRLPDKGSILIGGLKNIRTSDKSSSTPFIDRIPILSFFFSRKGRSDEITHLMILVSAEITDLREQEEQLMGRAGETGGFNGPYVAPPSPFDTGCFNPNRGSCSPCGSAPQAR